MYIKKRIRPQKLKTTARGKVASCHLLSNFLPCCTSGVWGLGRFGSRCTDCPSAYSNINNAPGF